MPIFCTQKYIISTSLCIIMERKKCYGEVISELSDLTDKFPRLNEIRKFLSQYPQFFKEPDEYLRELFGNGILIVSGVMAKENPKNPIVIGYKQISSISSDYEVIKYKNQPKYELWIFSTFAHSEGSHGTRYINHDYGGEIASGSRSIDFTYKHPLAEEIAQEHERIIGNANIRHYTKIITTHPFHSKNSGCYDIISKESGEWTTKDDLERVGNRR